MRREEIVGICERDVLAAAARAFGTSQDRLSKFDDYEGCANLVYQYECGGQSRVLRISYRPDRPVQQIEAELHFVNGSPGKGSWGSRRECACRSCGSDMRSR